MKKTILPKKNLAPVGHAAARSQRDQMKGHAKALVTGGNKPTFVTAKSFVKGVKPTTKGKSFGK